MVDFLRLLIIQVTLYPRCFYSESFAPSLVAHVITYVTCIIPASMVYILFLFVYIHVLLLFYIDTFLSQGVEDRILQLV